MLKELKHLGERERRIVEYALHRLHANMGDSAIWLINEDDSPPVTVEEVEKLAQDFGERGASPEAEAAMMARHPDVQKVAEQARQWLASPEGQAAVAEGLARAQEMAEAFREAQRVDWDAPFLRQPLDAAKRHAERRGRR